MSWKSWFGVNETPQNNTPEVTAQVAAEEVSAEDFSPAEIDRLCAKYDNLVAHYISSIEETNNLLSEVVAELVDERDASKELADRVEYLESKLDLIQVVATHEGHIDVYEHFPEEEIDLETVPLADAQGNPIPPPPPKEDTVDLSTVPLADAQGNPIPHDPVTFSTPYWEGEDWKPEDEEWDSNDYTASDEVTEYDPSKE